MREEDFDLDFPMPEAEDFEAALAAVFLSFRINGIQPSDIAKDFMEEFTKTFEADPEKMMDAFAGNAKAQFSFFSRDAMNCIQVLYLELGKAAARPEDFAIQTMRMMLLYCILNFAIRKGTKEPYVLCVCSSFVSLLLTIRRDGLRHMAEQNRIFLHVTLQREKGYTGILARVAFARGDAEWLGPEEDGGEEKS